MIFGPGKALEKIIAKLDDLGLEVNVKKFQVFGTTPDACDNMPEFLKRPFVITDPVEAARVAEAEAAAEEAKAAAKTTPSEEAEKAMKAANETAEAALNAVPEISRAYEVWTCGAAIG